MLVNYKNRKENSSTFYKIKFRLLIMKIFAKSLLISETFVCVFTGHIFTCTSATVQGVQ